MNISIVVGSFNIEYITALGNKSKPPTFIEELHRAIDRLIVRHLAVGFEKLRELIYLGTFLTKQEQQDGNNIWHSEQRNGIDKNPTHKHIEAHTLLLVNQPGDRGNEYDKHNQLDTEPKEIMAYTQAEMFLNPLQQPPAEREKDQPHKDKDNRIETIVQKTQYPIVRNNAYGFVDGKEKGEENNNSSKKRAILFFSVRYFGMYFFSCSDIDILV